MKFIKIINNMNFKYFILAILQSLGVFLFGYLAFFQSPILSKREYAITIIFWFALTPLVNQLPPHFLLTVLTRLTLRVRYIWNLLSIGADSLSTLSSRLLLLTPHLPVFLLQIDFPARYPERTISLKYTNPPPHIIKFGEYKLAGKRQQIQKGLIHKGTEPALLSCSGRTGEVATLVFANLPGIEGVLAGWDVDFLPALYGNIIFTRVTGDFERSTDWAFSRLLAKFWPVSRLLFTPCPLTRFI